MKYGRIRQVMFFIRGESQADSAAALDNILYMMSSFRCERIILASNADVYGGPS
jgi:nucleoside-diphosphate-sugar epimerase